MTDYNPVYDDYHYKCSHCKHKWCERKKGYGNNKRRPFVTICESCSAVLEKKRDELYALIELPIRRILKITKEICDITGDKLEDYLDE